MFQRDPEDPNEILWWYLLPHGKLAKAVFRPAYTTVSTPCPPFVDRQPFDSAARRHSSWRFRRSD